MAIPTRAFKIRSPFAPNASWAQVEPVDYSYGFVLGSASRATFALSRNDVNSAPLLEAGAMLTIERSDSLLPWVGFITERRIKAGESTVQFTATDHFGAVLAKARTMISRGPLTMASGSLISLALGEARGRGEPPIDLAPPGDIGPPVTYELRAEQFDAFLTSLTRFTDYEWGLRHSITGDIVRSTLQWERRIGQRGGSGGVELYFEEGGQDEGGHFVDAEVIDNADGYLNAGLAVGGAGDFALRSAVQATVLGRGDAPGIVGIPSAPARDRPGGRQLRRTSPVFMGVRVVVDEQATGDAALQAAAQRAQQAPDYIGRHISFSVSEGAIGNPAALRLGARVGVRFQTLAFGLGLTAIVRVVQMDFGPKGVVALQCSVEDSAD